MKEVYLIHFYELIVMKYERRLVKLARIFFYRIDHSSDFVSYTLESNFNDLESFEVKTR